MIILELYAFGRVLRLRLSWTWRWWWARFGGVLIIEAGPLALQFYSRRIWWDRP